MGRNKNQHKTSKYKYVRKVKPTTNYLAKNPWETRVVTPFGVQYKTHSDERAAALWVDKVLLSLGKEPVNILKKL